MMVLGEVSTDLGQIMFGFRPGSDDSLNLQGFLGPFFFHREKFIHSCTHLTVVITVTKVRNSRNRCDTTCMLQTAQQVMMGLHMQVYWESLDGASDVNLRCS
jgi:hypothetical protein